jgi:flagellar biosynthetic protein FliR
MDSPSLAQFVTAPEWLPIVPSPWLTWGMSQFVAFALATARLVGLFAVAPMFGHVEVRWTWRIALAAMLALLVTTACFGAAAEATPATFVELLGQAAAEAAVGVVIGLGVAAVFGGLQLAGQLIDQQTGLALAEMLNPDLKVSGSVTGHALYLLGLTIFLLLGGHVLAVTHLLESFRAVPPGRAVVSASLIGMLSSLIGQSFALAIQVAAPIVATLALVTLLTGLANRSLQQFGLADCLFAGRVLLSWLLIGVVATQLADGMPSLLRELMAAANSVVPPPHP